MNGLVVTPVRLYSGAPDLHTIIDILSHPIINGLILGPVIGLLLSYFFMPPGAGNSIGKQYVTVNHVVINYPGANNVQNSDAFIPACLFVSLLVAGLIYLYVVFAYLAITILTTVAAGVVVMCVVGAVRTPENVVWFFVPAFISVVSVRFLQIAWENRQTLRSFHLPDRFVELPGILLQPAATWALLQASGIVAVAIVLVHAAVFASFYLPGGNRSGPRFNWRVRWLNIVRRFCGVFGVFMLVFMCGAAWLAVSVTAFRYITSGTF
ncbi:hypothetical protein [Agrobacterium radiobacter]|uniref:hypothetical protein n=1 Tax=Agrobacterium radiobacter TaxID=362 RepID=UPI0016056BD0|nr:hypothetical protein [Agrobacterium radiobacter]MBB4408135.1 hypothetical protein [Agrobacterium radiobacter]MBB4453506.1 hypothetical protein [Agrobacterium radiobacter]